MGPANASTARVLEPGDLDAALRVLARDPVTNAFVASRVRAAGLDPWRLGGEMWGWFERGELVSMCYSGANLMLIGAGEEAVRSFAERARRQGRRCSSIVGPAGPTAMLWALLEPHWGPAREIRSCQPVMATSEPSERVAPDPFVRRVRREEIDVVLPACVRMFTEEVGVSPLAGDGGLLYRARVAELITTGRAFARIEDGDQVLFKAEIGAVTDRVCQIQGVWVPPEHRGKGLARAGMAAVLEYALREVAPVASLYVNDFNLPARAAYRAVGFEEVGTFMSVLF
ncbi:GNAT family N-acetyltransferase [Allostreptomyces psammosilenae]|uniref:GNAT family N-acetyltransferase n=1 Tax=Allostreptomyces psammosilenae TaxID=1892865 RepID=UPI0015C848A0|nr:GNAT family N-acetyltransferase [Allostreptomyces psammosilenae]